jgi:hypothetical protein
MSVASWIALAVAVGVPMFLYPIFFSARRRDDNR